MEYPKSLFLEVCRDGNGKVWGKARICLKDGGCLVMEGRAFRSYGQNAMYAGADGVNDDDELPASVEHQALDDALDKLCRITKNKAVMRAIPPVARVALKLVCTARNLQKIKQAAEQKGDDEEFEEAAGALKKMARHRNPIMRRAVGALRIWQ